MNIRENGNTFPHIHRTVSSLSFFSRRVDELIPRCESPHCRRDWNFDAHDDLFGVQEAPQPDHLTASVRRRKYVFKPSVVLVHATWVVTIVLNFQNTKSGLIFSLCLNMF